MRLLSFALLLVVACGDDDGDDDDDMIADAGDGATDAPRDVISEIMDDAASDAIDDVASDAMDAMRDAPMRGEIPCGDELTCGADQYCVNVCDCCGAPPPPDSGIEFSSHYECRACVQPSDCEGDRMRDEPCA